MLGENYAMVLLTEIGIRGGLKFPVQNCTPDQKEKDTHVHREKIYILGENLFPLREIIACSKVKKKEDRKCSPAESSLAMAAFTWLSHAQLCVSGVQPPAYTPSSPLINAFPTLLFLINFLHKKN